MVLAFAFVGALQYTRQSHEAKEKAGKASKGILSIAIFLSMIALGLAISAAPGLIYVTAAQPAPAATSAASPPVHILPIVPVKSMQLDACWAAIPTTALVCIIIPLACGPFVWLCAPICAITVGYAMQQVPC